MSYQLDFPQGSPEWKQARVGLLTGSRVASVFSRNSKGQPGAEYENLLLELTLERITGESEPVYVNDAMRRGTELEPLAREAYEIHTGILIRECGLFVSNVLQAGSSPDGVDEFGGCIEIKCPGAKAHLSTIQSGEIPAKYLHQCLHHLWMTGREWCDFVSYHPGFPEHLRLFVSRIEYKHEKMQGHIDDCINFLIKVDHEVVKLMTVAA